MSTDFEYCSSFDWSSTTSDNSDQEIIENDVLEILPDKDYKTRSLSKDILVSSLYVEDYKKLEEDIYLLEGRKLNWVEISEILDFSKKNNLLDLECYDYPDTQSKKYQHIHENIKDEPIPFKHFFYSSLISGGSIYYWQNQYLCFQNFI